MNTLVKSNEVRQAMMVGYKNHRRFYPLERRGTLHRPLFWNGFWFETLKSRDIIPYEARKALSDLDKSGIEYQEVIIGHEAPKLLSGPVKQKKPLIDTKKVTQVISDAMPILGALTVALVEVFVAAVTGIAMVMAFMGMIFFQTILVDPVLVVVLSDGSWLVVATWYE